MSDPPLVWVTRTRPGAEFTAECLRALSLQPLVSPLLRVRPLRPRLALDQSAALAFTSPNAVRAFARLTSRRDRPAYAVGDATAEAARAAGFADVRSASGDLNALAALIAAQPPPGPLLVLGAREPAGDLPAMLAERGVAARAVAVYAAVSAPARRGRRALAEARLAAVLIHSPRAAAALAEGWPRHLARPPAVIAISAAAARPLTALGLEVAVAARPDETALLAALAEALGNPRPPV